MQSQTEDPTSDQMSTIDTQKKALTSFKLYEEFSRNDIAVTILARASDYEKATTKQRIELEKRTEAEVENFRKWLEETKKVKPMIAHYCAVSIKSLLLGLPIGVQIARIFSIPLNNLFENQIGTSFSSGTH